MNDVKQLDFVFDNGVRLEFREREGDYSTIRMSMYTDDHVDISLDELYNFINRLNEEFLSFE